MRPPRFNQEEVKAALTQLACSGEFARPGRPGVRSPGLNFWIVAHQNLASGEDLGISPGARSTKSPWSSALAKCQPNVSIVAWRAKSAR